MDIKEGENNMNEHEYYEKLRWIIEELKIVRDSFYEKYEACPVCIIEATNVLESIVEEEMEKEIDND